MESLGWAAIEEDACPTKCMELSRMLGLGPNYVVTTRVSCKIHVVLEEELFKKIKCCGKYWNILEKCFRKHFRAIILYNFQRWLTQQQCIDELNSNFKDISSIKD